MQTFCCPMILPLPSAKKNSISIFNMMLELEVEHRESIRPERSIIPSPRILSPTTLLQFQSRFLPTACTSNMPTQIISAVELASTRPGLTHPAIPVMWVLYFSVHSTTAVPARTVMGYCNNSNNLRHLEIEVIPPSHMPLHRAARRYIRQSHRRPQWQLTLFTAAAAAVAVIATAIAQLGQLNITRATKNFTHRYDNIELNKL